MKGGDRTGGATHLLADQLVQAAPLPLYRSVIPRALLLLLLWREPLQRAQTPLGCSHRRFQQPHVVLAQPPDRLPIEQVRAVLEYSLKTLLVLRKTQRQVEARVAVHFFAVER